jgi:hypothetical protein
MSTPIVTTGLLAAAAAALVALEEEKRKLERERLDLARGQAQLLREREKLAEEKAAFAKGEATASAAASGPPPTSRHASVAPVLAMEGGRLLVPTWVTYAWCCVFRTAPRATRGQVSPARRSQFLRVARLGLHAGRSLDAHGVAFRWIRYVAYGDGAAQQHDHLEQILRGERPKSPPRKARAPARRAGQAVKSPGRRRR